MTCEADTDLWQSLSAWVAGRLGLQFERERWPDLRRGVESAGRELGLEGIRKAADYFLARQSDAEAIKVLARHLTIGETYFFRDPNVFAALETNILPQLISARRKTLRYLRIWSAGCCTGEEPYSLAILLSRLLPDIADWDITILGTDVNSGFLRKAESGVYTKWSFRNVARDLQSTCFAQTNDGRFAILPKFKNLVTFGFLNLVSDRFPSLVNNTNAMDIILCRNVLMYFAPKQTGNVMNGLQEALIRDGWLITGAADCVAGNPSLVPVSFPGVTAHRKIEMQALERTLAPESPIPQPSLPPPVAVTTSPKVNAVNVRDMAHAARAHADRGEFIQAAQLCEQALSLNKLDSTLHYLHGMILQELKRLDEAVASLRRALYLDHEFVLAEFALGMIMRQKDNLREETRHFERALHILSTWPSDKIIPESSGVTAGRLKEVIELTLQLK